MPNADDWKGMPMRLLVAVLSGFVIAASAFAQGLPQSVADAYRGYEAAVAAENYALAAQQGRIAWQAAEDEGVEPATIGILAANYAEVATIIGQHADAALAYERAADISRDQSDFLAASNRLIGAAQAHFAAENYRETRRQSLSALDLLDDLSQSDERNRGLYHANMLLAYAYMRSGNSLRAGRFAREGLEILSGIGSAINNDTAVMTFLAGLNSASQRDLEDAAYYLTLSSYINDHIGSGHETSAIARAWARYMRSRMEPVELAQLMGRLQNSGYRPAECEVDSYSCYEEPDWAADLRTEHEVVDAVAETRRPPRYPESAAYAGLEGLVLIEVTVDANGRAVDPEIIYSIPLSDFGDAALDAVRRWRWQPARVDGVPVERPGLIVQIEFELVD